MLSRASLRGTSSLLEPFICARCLRHQSQRLRKPPPLTRRTYATSTPASSSSIPSAPLRDGITALPHRKLLSLSGPDAPKFLQGLTTNNVPTPAQNPENKGWYTGFLNAQGRVLYDAFVYPCAHVEGSGDGWACFIEVGAGCRDGLRTLLKRHKLRSKVKIEPVEEWGVWSAWRDGEDAAQLAIGDGDKADFIHLPDARVPAFGHRILLPLSAEYLSSSSSSSGAPPPDLPASFQDLPAATPGAYTLRRYLNGLAEGPTELRPGEALPLESNMDIMHGVDFRKGCYVGQELTIRTKHTGVVRKRILPVQLYNLAQDEPQTLEYHPGEGNWQGKGLAGEVPEATDIKKATDFGEQGGPKRSRSAGKWLDGVGNLGLALCRLEMMTDVKVGPEPTGSGGFKPGMRFEMKWTPEGQEERGIGIKAFVPEWHQQRMAEEAEQRGKKKKVVEED